MEDEPRLAAFLETGLRAAGYTTMVCADGVQAASMARDARFELLILDLGLPGQDGLAVLRAVRRRGERIPVLVLTGRTHVEDTVAALDEGADDYVTKPFDFGELLARVRARVRGREQIATTPVLEAAGLRLDLRSRRASAGGAEVPLTAREFTLLETFMRHPGRVLSRDELRSRAWHDDAGVSSNLVDVYVRKLRRKIGAERVETVRGLGYRLPPG